MTKKILRVCFISRTNKQSIGPADSVDEFHNILFFPKFFRYIISMTLDVVLSFFSCIQNHECIIWKQRNLTIFTVWPHLYQNIYLPTSSLAPIIASDKNAIAVANSYCSLNGTSSINAFFVSLVTIKAANPMHTLYAMIDYSNLIFQTMKSSIFGKSKR